MLTVPFTYAGKIWDVPVEYVKTIELFTSGQPTMYMLSTTIPAYGHTVYQHVTEDYFNEVVKSKEG